MTVMKDMNQSDRKHTGDGTGDDADKTAQSITSRDIRAVAISAEPVDERLAALKSMKTELEARLSADGGGDPAKRADAGSWREGRAVLAEMSGDLQLRQSGNHGGRDRDRTCDPSRVKRMLSR